LRVSRRMHSPRSDKQSNERCFKIRDSSHFLALEEMLRMTLI
jgi:hypothetical protein